MVWLKTQAFWFVHTTETCSHSPVLWVPSWQWVTSYLSAVFSCAGKPEGSAQWAPGIQRGLQDTAVQECMVCVCAGTTVLQCMHVSILYSSEELTTTALCPCREQTVPCSHLSPRGREDDSGIASTHSSPQPWQHLEHSHAWEVNPRNIFVGGCPHGGCACLLCSFKSVHIQIHLSGCKLWWAISRTCQKKS